MWYLVSCVIVYRCNIRIYGAFLHTEGFYSNCTRQSIKKPVSWFRKKTLLPSNTVGDCFALSQGPNMEKSCVHIVLGFNLSGTDGTYSVSEQTGQK
jgi:hypothetical protein